MWKKLWKRWTLDKPAALGDWLWEVFVVQLAAFLDRLTLRKIIAFIPVVILVLAYAHRIPIPPELVFVGDLLAYMDVFAVIFLLGLLSRTSTVLLIIRQIAEHAVTLASGILVRLQRLDFRHRRETGVDRRKRRGDRDDHEDDEFTIVQGVAWA